MTKISLFNKGGEGVRPYWDKYFGGAEGIIFVVDSSASDEDLQLTNNELHKVLADPELDNLPLMVLCNYSDKEGAKSKEEVLIISFLILLDTYFCDTFSFKIFIFTKSPIYFFLSSLNWFLNNIDIKMVEAVTMWSFVQKHMRFLQFLKLKL